eukprot:6370666-Prymnesium_polylepis.1
MSGRQTYLPTAAYLCASLATPNYLPTYLPVTYLYHVTAAEDELLVAPERTKDVAAAARRSSISSIMLTRTVAQLRSTWQN